jgi:hypothetical protein
VGLIAENLQRIEERIESAVARAGRKRSEITLIGVTKTFPAAKTIEAYEAGIRHFGENFVQEFEEKSAALADLTDARYAMIGHLQSNKAKKAAELFHSVQTVHSAKLARKLSATGKPMEIMIEVKLGDEESKHGVAPDQLAALVQQLRELENLRLTGLMTIPPFLDNPEDVRPYFARMRELAATHDLTSISMGMSNDFEVAIEEGATHIRIGTALIGQRDYR